MPEHAIQTTQLLAKTTEFCSNHGESVVRSISKNSKLIVLWLPYLSTFQKTGTADDLLTGLQSSIVEAAACAALGLIRPALFSMRTEIDLALSWIFFKDHSIEWLTVNQTGEGFKLKKEILEYLDKNYIGFKARHGILNEIKTRKEIDTYRLLSAHIHAQSKVTMPNAINLAEVVKSEKLGKECALIASEVDEYISDILFCIYAEKWTALPALLIASINSRFKTATQKTTFFKGI